MISYSNILFVKENLILINILAGIFSFIIGVSPLMIDREMIERQTKPVLLEFTAFIFLLYTIIGFGLDWVASEPLYKKYNCISFKEKYYVDNEFKKYFYLEDKMYIKEVGEENYLLLNLNNKILYKMPMTEDFKYKKVDCPR